MLKSIYLCSETINNELIGIDKSKSGSISTYKLKISAIDRIYARLDQTDGNIYPESQFPENGRIC